MNALQFLKTAKRICAEHKDHSGSDLLCVDYNGCDLLRLCSNEIRNCPDSLLAEIVDTVEQYNKGEPTEETRKDRLLRYFPKTPIKSDGTPDLCPENYCEDNYYDSKLFLCEEYNDCDTCKHEYWSHEPQGKAFWDKDWETDHGC